MKEDSIRNQDGKFQRTLDNDKEEHYFLRLFVTGTTPKSLRAITNIKRICEEHLKNRYSLEVVDVYQQPLLAKTEQIIAAPTLVKLLPFPLRKLIGDLANTDRTLLGLDLRPKGAVGKKL
ncbi:MAG TPA: circadian clock KaiB family protein [Verrucomicrobiae bacterium]|nr:circadian clock KaiB family protein [Verrucomicrobiae bacterium]